MMTCIVCWIGALIEGNTHLCNFEVNISEDNCNEDLVIYTTTLSVVFWLASFHPEHYLRSQLLHWLQLSVFFV